MSDTPNFDFSKFVPGFDFLQNLTKGATQKIPQMPKLGGWVAPTINVEELDKRIDELKAVQFWLDQNAAALKATIQALEVQKMTLATLKGMNFSMGDLANAFKLKTPESMFDTSPKAADKAPEPVKPKVEEADEPEAAAPASESQAAGKVDGPAAPGVVDPLQWWNSLTTQFQQIAAGALKEAASKTAADSGKAANFAKEAFKSAEEFAKAAAKPLVAAAGERPADKPAAKSATKSTSGPVAKTSTQVKPPAKKTAARKTASKTNAAAKKRTR